MAIDNNDFLNSNDSFDDDFNDIQELLQDAPEAGSKTSSRAKSRKADSSGKAARTAKATKAEKTKNTKERKSSKASKHSKATEDDQEPYGKLGSVKVSGSKEKKEKKPKKEKPPKDPKKAKRIKITLGIICFLLVAAFIAVTVWAYMVSKTEATLPKVTADGVNVGSMTREQVDAALSESGWDEKVSTVLTINLPAEVSFTVDYCDSNANMTREQAVDAAMAYGHDGNIYQNLWLYLVNHVIPADVALDERVLDEDYIKGCMSTAIDELTETTKDDSYQVDEDDEKLVLRKGAGQIKLDEDGLYEQIVSALRNDQSEISYSQLTGTIKMPDFDAIHDELAVEPSDAYFTDDFEIVPEVVGCWFDVADAEDLWKAAEPGDFVEIPLDITYPEETEETLSSLLYRDLLGSQTTLYTWSTDNRISNINLAVSKINGIILMPGDTFSYNEAVGQRTEENGFKEAGAYDNGQVVQEVGGGICQVSSTLYCAQMYAQLETTARTNHYFKVDYLDYGMDATVSWGKPDYKFTNSRDYPVKIVAYCDNEEKSLTVEIWGTDVDGSYVTLRSSKLVVYDSVYTSTVVGYGVTAYRTVYDAEGNYLYEIQEPYGIYYRHDEDIEWPAEKYAADAAAAS